MPAYAPASPYLEERLATARREIARLQAGAREIHEWAGRINELSNATATELRRAADELTFARARGLVDTRPRQAEPPGPRSEGGIPVAPIPAPLSENRDAAALPEERSEGGGPSGRFHAFTVAEYNQSIGALQRRWPWVAGFAVLVGGTISLLLVAIAYDTHAPATSWWLALLPVVWMIPVPFFLLAFRGTRRILRRHDLTLEESS